MVFRNRFVASAWNKGGVAVASSTDVEVYGNWLSGNCNGSPDPAGPARLNAPTHARTATTSTTVWYRHARKPSASQPTTAPDTPHNITFTGNTIHRPRGWSRRTPTMPTFTIRLTARHHLAAQHSSQYVSTHPRFRTVQLLLPLQPPLTSARRGTSERARARFTPPHTNSRTMPVTNPLDQTNNPHEQDDSPPTARRTSQQHRRLQQQYIAASPRTIPRRSHFCTLQHRPVAGMRLAFATAAASPLSHPAPGPAAPRRIVQLGAQSVDARS